MFDFAGNSDPLIWAKFDRLILKIDEEPPVHNEEEFVLVLMVVPVEFTLYDTDTNHAVIHLAESLVEPRVRYFVPYF